MSTASEQLTVERLIRASPQRVFAAWTDPAMIVQWWGAGDVTCPTAEMDLAVGGVYRIANQTPDGSTMWITGTFNRIDPPNELAYTWAMEPIGPDTVHSSVEVTFRPEAAGTLVTVHQTRIADTATRDTHVQGWTGCLERLDRLF